MDYQRSLSTVERYYVSCDTHGDNAHTPCVNQIVIEGHGEVDVKKLAAAITTASQANPGSRLILKGHLGFSRWVDSGNTVRLRMVNAKGWQGQCDEGSYFLKHALLPRSGPTTDAVLVSRGNDKYYLIFRSHHGVMDGRGTQHFVNDVFRVLRGESPVGENSRLNDVELARLISRQEKASNLDCDVLPPTGTQVSHAASVSGRWIRRTITGRHKSLLARVALEIANYTRSNGAKIVRFQLPVDMRGRKQNLHSTANLTGGIVLNVSAQTTIEDWNSDIRQQILLKKEAEIPRFFRFFPFTLLNWVPLWVMKNSNTKLANKRRQEARFRTTGIISNLGLLSLAEFSGAGFKADGIFFVPPEFDTTALFVTLTGHENGVEILMRAPGYLDGGRLDELMDFVVDGLHSRVELAS